MTEDRQKYTTAPPRATESAPDSISLAEPQWIVNDLGELGVMVAGCAYFLYKGDSIEYSGVHEDGTAMLYRMVGKREFGEVCHPFDWDEKKFGLQDRYTRELVFTPGLSYGSPHDADWKPLQQQKAPEPERAGLVTAFQAAARDNLLTNHVHSPAYLQSVTRLLEKVMEIAAPFDADMDRLRAELASERQAHAQLRSAIHIFANTVCCTGCATEIWHFLGRQPKSNEGTA